jgi:hypothetical protein
VDAAGSGPGGLSPNLVPAPDGRGQQPKVSGGIAMNDYEIICKGTVIIGSLQARS